MTRSDYYRSGRAYGERVADIDARDGGGLVSETLAGAREDAANAMQDSTRAYWLGFLRSYREAVRTKIGGRWGT
jgi:hypothetical protein